MWILKNFAKLKLYPDLQSFEVTSPKYELSMFTTRQTTPLPPPTTALCGYLSTLLIAFYGTRCDVAQFLKGNC